MTENLSIAQPHHPIQNSVMAFTFSIYFYLLHAFEQLPTLKVKTSIGNAPISKNEMEANMFLLIHDDKKFAGKPPTNWYIW